VVRLGAVHRPGLDHHRVVQTFCHLVLQRVAQSRALGELAYLRKLGDLKYHDQCGAQTNVAQCARLRRDFRYVRHAVAHRVERSYDHHTIFHHVGQTVCRHEAQRIFRHDLQTACHREARRACHHVGQSYARHDRQTAYHRVVRRGVIHDQHNHHHLEPNYGRC